MKNDAYDIPISKRTQLEAQRVRQAQVLSLPACDIVIGDRIGEPVSKLGARRVATSRELELRSQTDLHLCQSAHGGFPVRAGWGLPDERPVIGAYRMRPVEAECFSPVA